MRIKSTVNKDVGESSQLVKLLLLHKQNNKEYDLKLVETLKKLITKTFKVQGYTPIRVEEGDLNDTYQDYYLHLLKKIKTKLDLDGILIELLGYKEELSKIPTSINKLENKIAKSNKDVLNYITTESLLDGKSLENIYRKHNKRIYNFFTITCSFHSIHLLKKMFLSNSRAEVTRNLVNSNFTGKTSYSIEDQLETPFPELFGECKIKREIANLLSSGHTKTEVKKMLNITQSTLRTHLNEIKETLKDTV